MFIPAMFCFLTTSLQRVLSARTVAARSCGEPPPGSIPCAASLARVSGSARKRIVAALSFSITSAGVPAGTINAYHDTASNFGTPCSAIVGSSGKSGERFWLATPSARSLPLLTKGSAVCSGANIIETWPPTRSLTAGAMPR